MCLMEKVRQEGGPFAVAHCNFGLRGAESDADEAFVREQAARHGIPCHVKQFDTEAFASAEGISIEMAARELRYNWFAEETDIIYVAHHRDDQVETVLMNIITLFVEVLVSIPLGILAARKQYHAADYIVTVFALACIYFASPALPYLFVF